MSSGIHAEGEVAEKLIAAVPHLVWMCRGDGPCDYLSPQWEAYTGIPAEVQLGSRWLEQIHPDDQARTQSGWQASVVARTCLDIEFRIRRYDGVYRWFATRAVPELDTDGNILRWYGTNTDMQALYDAREDLRSANESLAERVATKTAELEDSMAELREVTAQLELSHEITQTGSWSFDLRTNKVVWSRELFQILRRPYDTQAVPYEEQHRLYSPASWAALQLAVARAAEQGESYELELRLAPSDEGERWARALGRAERDETGRIVRLNGTFQDVSDEVRERREREQLAARYSLATGSATIGVWEWDVKLNHLTWNPEMYELYGLPVGTPVDYETWRSAMLPEDVQAVEALLADAVAGRGEFRGTFRVQQPAGPIRHLRATASVERDDTGAALRVTGVNWDITAEERARRVARDSIARLREFIRTAPAAIAMLDRDLRYIEASDRWIADYALDRTQTIGALHYDIFPHIPERWKAIHQDTLAGQVHRHDADAFVQPDGSTTYLQWETQPWQGSDGEIAGLIMFSRDITSMIELQMRERAQAQELVRRNADLQSFAYAASHDLQEPLRAVAGFSQLLAARYRDKLDAEANTMIQHMVDGAGRMRQLIEDLLAFSRVGTQAEGFEVVDMREAIDDALRNLHTAIEESDVRISVGHLPAVHGDRRQLVQLWQNLLGNAIKYRREHSPRIVVGATRSDEGWEFSVRDYGIGIPVDAHERIFQIFQRLHTREEYPGTGVGLALCRRIVDRHGGTIRVVHVEEPGTEFRVTLPERAVAA